MCVLQGFTWLPFAPPANFCSNITSMRTQWSPHFTCTTSPSLQLAYSILLAQFYCLPHTIIMCVCVCVCELVAQLCPTLCDPMDCSLPGSSVRGILPARILEWIAISFSRGSSWPRNETPVSCTAGRFFTFWATRETHYNVSSMYHWFCLVVYIQNLK